MSGRQVCTGSPRPHPAIARQPPTDRCQDPHGSRQGQTELDRVHIRRQKLVPLSRHGLATRRRSCERPTRAVLRSAAIADCSTGIRAGRRPGVPPDCRHQRHAIGSHRGTAGVRSQMIKDTSRPALPVALDDGPKLIGTCSVHDDAIASEIELAANRVDTLLR